MSDCSCRLWFGTFVVLRKANTLIKSIRAFIRQTLHREETRGRKYMGKQTFNLTFNNEICVIIKSWGIRYSCLQSSFSVSCYKKLLCKVKRVVKATLKQDRFSLLEVFRSFEHFCRILSNYPKLLESQVKRSGHSKQRKSVFLLICMLRYVSIHTHFAFIRLYFWDIYGSSIKNNSALNSNTLKDI